MTKRTEVIKYSQEKMEKFMERDALLRWAVMDLKKRGHEDASAKELTFNSYILDDRDMEDIYKGL